MLHYFLMKMNNNVTLVEYMGGLLHISYQRIHPFFPFFVLICGYIAGRQLMLHVAELVPRHPGRTKKQESASTSSAAPSKSGKGGKKKR